MLAEMNGDTESILERTVTNKISGMAGTNRTLQQNHSQPVIHELHPFALDVSNYGRSSENKTDRSRRVLSQMGHLPESMFMSSDESRLLEHQFVRKVDSREKIQTVPLGFDHMDIPLSSTMDNEISEIKRPFSQLMSVATDEMFSDIPLDSTLRNKSASFQLEGNGLEYDSLASTSLSMAFSGEGVIIILLVIAEVSELIFLKTGTIWPCSHCVHTVSMYDACFENHTNVNISFFRYPHQICDCFV